MGKIIVALILAVGLIGIGGPVAVDLMTNSISTEIVNTSYIQESIPKQESKLESNTDFKIFNVKKTITLEEKNTVVFRGPVTSESVSDVMNKLKNVSRSISKRTPIYLVLDTPGGSVFDGLEFIDFTNALPQKVHTITLFAASMGFQIAQNLDTRYITPSGTLMSHRARGGVRGQFDGELETRYKMIKRAIDYMDYKASKRMDMDLKEYKSMIKDEYWVHGFDAIQDKAADEKVLIRCGSSLDGSEKVKLVTFFGTATVEFSKCPMIKAPLGVSMEYAKNATNKQKQYLNHLHEISFIKHKQFIKEIIDTDELGNVFPIR